jgi:hypothetical protein
MREGVIFHRATARKTETPMGGQNKNIYNIFILVFEVLITVVMKSFLFQDTTPCSPLRISLLYLQGRKINQASYELYLLLLSCWFLAWLIPRP